MQAFKKAKIQPLDFASPAKEIKHTFVTDLDGDMAEIEVSYLNNVKLNDKEQAGFRGDAFDFREPLL